MKPFYKTIIIVSCFLILMIIIIVLATRLAPSGILSLLNNWPERMRPPPLKEKVVVYLSAPEFTLADNLYAVGINGLGTGDVQSSFQDSFCNLDDQSLELIREVSDALRLPRNGVVELISNKGWSCYCPARDGLDPLPRYIDAVNSELSKGQISQQEGDTLIAYLSKGIYANDVYALGAVCNTCIFNSNGLQIDDGAAAEMGMVGCRGLPTVYYRSQWTDQFGPGASNPMPLGNASSIMTQRSNSIQSAVELLDNKINNLKNSNDWWSEDYPNQVPPPPLVLFWLEVGEAVYLTRFKTRDIIMDPTTGKVDRKQSYTDFFYQRWFSDDQKGLVEIAQKIRDNVQVVEKKWSKLIAYWAGCKNPEKVTLQQIFLNTTLCDENGDNS